MTEAEQIAEFIAEKGVKKCPTRFAAETHTVADVFVPDRPVKHLRRKRVGNRYIRSGLGRARKKFWLPQP